MKWQYEIILKTTDKKEYLIWTYSSHFNEEIGLSRKGKKQFISVADLYGTRHSQTAVQWILGLWKDIKEGNREDRVKKGMFNPHFRLNNERYPDVWVPVCDIKEIYFKMHLLDYGDNIETT